MMLTYIYKYIYWKRQATSVLLSIDFSSDCINDFLRILQFVFVCNLPAFSATWLVTIQLVSVVFTCLFGIMHLSGKTFLPITKTNIYALEPKVRNTSDSVDCHVSYILACIQIFLHWQNLSLIQNTCSMHLACLQLRGFSLAGVIALFSFSFFRSLWHLEKSNGSQGSKSNFSPSNLSPLQFLPLFKCQFIFLHYTPISVIPKKTIYETKFLYCPFDGTSVPVSILMAHQPSWII